MRTFQLEKVFALDEEAEDLPKDTIIGYNLEKDWFIFDKLTSLEGVRLSPYMIRKDFADSLLLGVYEENKPIIFFRDYWSFICNESNFNDPYLRSIIVVPKKTQILGVMEEWA